MRLETDLNERALGNLGAGDLVWAFTRRRLAGRYELAGGLVVGAVACNVPNDRCGAFRAWDAERSLSDDAELVP